ncbi:C-type lectin domain family 2 member F isoform X2 [Scomber japonicus]|uniref:C-type lectin domain family 2 member F isoform X2 n=1 Tax=Scomber japonicus TaxID=13676 RepID=UPI0023068E85|nr:C-type lectin domain family 2 member F isoform X2 [Scomber japonicus]
MYIKFCRNYGADKKDEAGTGLSPESKLSVDLEGKKAGNQTQGNVFLYRVACLSLSIICLLLLLVVVVLGMKLQTGSTAVCDGTEETTPENKQCSMEHCRRWFPNRQTKQVGCHQCPDGWIPLGRSCFYLSRFRLNWDEGQRNCTARGGSLAVISDPTLQTFLTEQGEMKYWIGLRRQGGTWNWVNNTVLQQSYWSDAQPKGDCGVLSSTEPAEKNWMKARCEVYTYFICQRQF